MTNSVPPVQGRRVENSHVTARGDAGFAHYNISGLPSASELSAELDAVLPYGTESSICSVEELGRVLDLMEEDQRSFAQFTQEQVDYIFQEVAREANMSRVQLAQFAVDDTKRGVVEDKVIKNHFASEFIYNKYKDSKTCGVIEEDRVMGYTKYAEPIGPIAGIIPVTNPTSTVIFKALIALKTRNCILFSPHPAAARVCAYTAELLRRAAVKAGAPEHCIHCVSGNRETAMAVLTHKNVHFTLATGGPGIVGAVYRSGKPAIGVGPGNAPALIDEFADLPTAVSSVVLSKTFDNGMICASENALVVVDAVYEEVCTLLRKRGCLILDKEQTSKLGKALIQDGHLNADMVGQSAHKIGEISGIDVPKGTVALVGEAVEIGYDEPMSFEKLSPIIGMYHAADFEDALHIAHKMASFGGEGHTAILYTDSKRRDRITEFEKRMPTYKVLINQPSAFGAIGDIYNFSLAPSLTLGCGAKGGSSVSTNVGPEHLIHVKTVTERRENMLWFKVPRSIYFKRGIFAEAMRDLKGAMRAIIITDRTMVSLGLINPLLDVLKAGGMAVRVFDEVTPDPTITCINRGMEAMMDFKPDTVVAFGGGSPIDAAKVMRLMYEHPHMTMSSLTARFMDIRKRVMDFPALGTKVKNLICVPTTSGTGAEVTPFAVVTGSDGRKYPICDYSLTPEMAIIDPNFTQGMPPKLTAATGFDALVHAVESYVSTFATDFTKAQSLHATKLINANLEASYQDSCDEFARENMHNGSAIAGMAFANAFLGICHSLAHQLGAQFHIPHGTANALMLSHVIAFNATHAPMKMAAFSQYKYPMAVTGYAEIADALGITNAGDTDDDKVWALINRFETLKANIDLPLSIKDAGVTWDDFSAKLNTMAAMAFDDQCTGANPRYPLINELKQLLVDAYHGGPRELGMTLHSGQAVVSLASPQKKMHAASFCNSTTLIEHSR
uniref:Alcohol dehydrogenase 4 n=1 Tax=Tetraselmis sp. GSL018 TaxID=582737 RepID=A0A061RWL3_9CHLO|eukprot:CAMPEP_0177607790 /NCGR_PEP_ID=MMETSP0419_2-20121207/18111_1 /TAXON_ID=582737 /ORGANISM="Tetraselmis sp., Strain GSL018" /LENGTH=953 /DNA_ID=CAMNT_0019102407 /DNA_START=361 /DNA_END=3222 /DNA_ORIENTATION=-